MTRDLEEEYRELLDEIYEPVRFGDLTFSPSAIIEGLDPIAFRCGVADFYSDEMEEED